MPQLRKLRKHSNVVSVQANLNPGINLLRERVPVWHTKKSCANSSILFHDDGLTSRLVKSLTLHLCELNLLKQLPVLGVLGQCDEALAFGSF